MNTTRTMTKSPLAFARQALEIARATLPAYSSKFSKKDFTLHQHFAILALKTFLKTDYRGIEAQLHDWSDLRDELGLAKVPDHSTLKKAFERLKKRHRCPIECDHPTASRLPRRFDATFASRHRLDQLRCPARLQLLCRPGQTPHPPETLAQTDRCGQYEQSPVLGGATD